MPSKSLVIVGIKSPSPVASHFTDYTLVERSVFHELTRTMQTRKLIAGETLLLEEEKGFCLVVDGLVQIFVKSIRDSSTKKGEMWLDGGGHAYEDEPEQPDGDHQGYQLLTEVNNGAPMSSLFSILSLFTEDVKLRHEEDDGPVLASSASSVGFGSALTPDSIPPSPASELFPMPNAVSRGHRTSIGMYLQTSNCIFRAFSGVGRHVLRVNYSTKLFHSSTLPREWKC